MVDVRHRLTLQPQDGCFVLYVEAAVSLFSLALQVGGMHSIVPGCICMLQLKGMRFSPAHSRNAAQQEGRGYAAIFRWQAPGSLQGGSAQQQTG